MKRVRLAGAVLAWSLGLAACSLLRPLDDLEASQGALAPLPCPDEMQQVRFEDGATFCIDRNETTRAEYDEFLAASPPVPAPTPAAAGLCPAEFGIEPGGGPDCLSAHERGVDPDLPVDCVDLCAAMAYCSYRGKRLCGGRNGEVVGQPAVNDRTKDEWFMACTGGTGRLYPYAPTFEPRRCNIGSAGLESVNSTRGCETPDHIQQLSGNVSEWVLICRRLPRLGETRCLARGGDYLSDRSLAGCHQIPRRTDDSEGPVGHLPTDRVAGVGIRCCGD